MTLTTKEFRTGSTRRRLLFGAAAVAGVVAVTVGILSSPSAGDTSPAGANEAAMSTPATPSAGQSTSAASDPGAEPAKGSLVPQTTVDRDPAGADWLTAAPLGLSWQRVDGVPLLFSGSDGPSRLNGPIAAGYTHTPQGATVAALQISMRLVYSPDYVRVLDEQTTLPQEQREQIISARALQPRLDSQGLERSTIAPTAFRVAAYTGDAALVEYAYPRADGSGTFRVAAIALAWSAGDWKYSGTPAASTSTETPNLDGFTPLPQ